MNRYFLAIPVMLLALCISNTPATAQEESIVSEGIVAECGVVMSFEDDDVFVEKDPMLDYCDIHGRRIAYRDQNMRFSKQLHERRKYYQAPGNLARQNYREAMEVLNQQRGGGNNAAAPQETSSVVAAPADETQPDMPATTKADAPVAAESEIREKTAEQAAANTELTNARPDLAKN